jgi:hypothetical protein
MTESAVVQLTAPTESVHPCRIAIVHNCTIEQVYRYENYCRGDQQGWRG